MRLKINWNLHCNGQANSPFLLIPSINQEGYMKKTCCVCESSHLMLYSQELDMGWCERHMPEKTQYEMALKGLKDPKELCPNT